LWSFALPPTSSSRSLAELGHGLGCNWRSSQN
jgi:hypothetical protein